MQSIKISFEEYLASVKKTEEEIKETYKKEVISTLIFIFSKHKEYAVFR